MCLRYPWRVGPGGDGWLGDGQAGQGGDSYLGLQHGHRQGAAHEVIFNLQQDGMWVSHQDEPNQ